MRAWNLYAALFAAVLSLPLPALMFNAEYRIPVGLPVYLPIARANCGDGRTIVVHVHGGGSLNLNTESLRRDELRGRLREVLATRAERLVFVQGDLNLNFGEVAQIIDIARTEADYVALLPADTEKEPGKHLSCCLTIIPRKGSVHSRK